MERAADALRELGCLFAPLRTADALADFIDLEAALPQQMPNRDEEMASRLKQRGNALSGGAFAMKLLRERLHGLVAPRFARLREILVARNPATDDDIILVSPATSCAACGSNNLQLGKDGRLTTRHLSPKIYSARGMRNGELHAKICGDCGAHHGLNFATLGPIPHGHCRLIRDSIAAPYYQGPDGQMVFSVPDVLLRMKAQAVHSHTAFETFASEYFSLTGTHLPRYPFQSAYLTFALMLMLDEFGLQEHACETPMALSRYTMTQGQSNLDRTLQTYAALLSPKFTKYYAGEHKLRCRLPNGHKDCIWIVDGHMKVKRTVCDNDAAREVDLGEIGINIMPCDRTPMRGQRFCYTCNEAAAYGPALCEPCKPCEPCEPTAPDALDAPDAPKAPDAPDAPRAPQVPPVPNTPPELTAPAAPAAPSLKPAPEPEPSARAMAPAEPSDSAMNVEAAVEAIEQEELAEYAPDERTPLDAQAQVCIWLRSLWTREPFSRGTQRRPTAQNVSKSACASSTTSIKSSLWAMTTCTGRANVTSTKPLLKLASRQHQEAKWKRLARRVNKSALRLVNVRRILRNGCRNTQKRAQSATPQHLARRRAPPKDRRQATRATLAYGQPRCRIRAPATLKTAIKE